MHASPATARIHFISLLIAYTLIVSLFAPFAIKRAQASPMTDEGVKKNAPALESVNRELSLNPSTQIYGKRLSDVLGRFGGGVSDLDH